MVNSEMILRIKVFKIFIFVIFLVFWIWLWKFVEWFCLGILEICIFNFMRVGIMIKIDYFFENSWDFIWVYRGKKE